MRNDMRRQGGISTGAVQYTAGEWRVLWLMGQRRTRRIYLGTREARGGADRGCDSDLAPEVGGRLELDPGRSSL